MPDAISDLGDALIVIDVNFFLFEGANKSFGNLSILPRASSLGDGNLDVMFLECCDIGTWKILPALIRMMNLRDAVAECLFERFERQRLETQVLTDLPGFDDSSENIHEQADIDETLSLRRRMPNATMTTLEKGEFYHE